MAGHQSPRERLESEERQRLSDVATLSTDKRLAHRVYSHDPDDYRTEFHRDYTRIIHSRAFRRLRHKTQVFISPKNDHLCTRMEHSLHVASVATSIARALQLNEDLVRAIAIGHDLGHAPFGHIGQSVLDGLAKANGGKGFWHELQSLRCVDFLESPYEDHNGLNLTFAVRDGIACHYGEAFEQELRADREKPEDSLTGITRGEAKPATLEGCVVRWADKVAYLGRDLEDAVELGMVKRAELPKAVRDVLGDTNKKIISSLVRELVRHGTGKDCLSVGSGVHEALNAFYKFNMNAIYKSQQATRHREQISRAMESLFALLLAELNKGEGNIGKMASDPHSCLKVFAQFLNGDIKDWQREKPAQVVIDFIAGMTDSFFVEAFTELFLPRPTV